MIVSDTKFEFDVSSAGRAKYRALANAIREGIVSKQLEEGERLPPVRDLAYRLGVTPGTVARAYRILTDEGRLETGVGRGTFVARRTHQQVGGLAQIPMQHPEGDQLHDAPVHDASEKAMMLSPKMPEVGQGAIIREGLQTLAQTLPTDALLSYPGRQSDRAARVAFQNTMSPDQVGRFGVEDVLVAHGGQNAIVVILQTILRGSAPVVAVDELTYGGFRSAASLTRAQTVGVVWDEHGPIPEALEQAIKREGVQAFLTSAEVCNPLVRTTSIRRRHEIAAVARRYGIAVIDDDCYRLMRSEPVGPNYRALLPELAWYVTSPSKSISAAFRIGFAISPRGWGNQAAQTAAYNSFGVSVLVSELYRFVAEHPRTPELLDRVRHLVAARVRETVNALGGHDLCYSEDVPFVWLDLPAGWRSGEFCAAAEAEGVLIKSSEKFTLRDGPMVHGVRLAMNGRQSPEHFRQALAALRRLLDSPPQRISV